MAIIMIILFCFCVFALLFTSIDWKDMEKKHKEKVFSYQKKVDEEKLLKGTMFEEQISDMIRKTVKDAIVINNCILNKKDKKGNDIYWNGTVASKEFDIICLSKKGIFVVEAKNYSQAFISGNFEDKTWLTSYSKSKVYSTYSPYKQVTEAVVTLKRYLPDYNIEKFVVFPNTTKISDNLKKSGQVMNFDKFRYKLMSFENRSNCLNKENINLVKNLLIEENERARKMNAETEHLKYVEKCKEAANKQPAIV